jgi:hypothetical protein
MTPRLLTLLAFLALIACADTQLGFELSEDSTGVSVTPTFTTGLPGGGDVYVTP